MNAHKNARSPGRHSALRIAVVQGALPDDWRDVHERLAHGAHGTATFLTKTVAALAAFISVVAVGCTLAHVALFFLPTVSPYLLAGAVLLPSMLVGTVAGQVSGNFFLKLYFHLDDATRRGFATRLSLARCPAEWPTLLKRWLFTGDWLGSPAYDLRLPYVRMYIEGKAPLTCREEDALWREIHGNISGDSLWEAGTNIREISYPHELPAWSRMVGKGDGYADLQARIGAVEASSWVHHLWRRACRQWPALGANDYPEQARRECFEMHNVSLAGGRQALIVVLRPTSFVMELDAGLEPAEEAAA